MGCLARGSGSGALFDVVALVVVVDVDVVVEVAALAPFDWRVTLGAAVAFAVEVEAIATLALCTVVLCIAVGAHVGCLTRGGGVGAAALFDVVAVVVLVVVEEALAPFAKCVRCVTLGAADEMEVVATLAL